MILTCARGLIQQQLWNKQSEDATKNTHRKLPLGLLLPTTAAAGHTVTQAQSSSQQELPFILPAGVRKRLAPCDRLKQVGKRVSFAAPTQPADRLQGTHT